MVADKSSLCSLCGEIDSDANLSECRDKKSWITLLHAAKIPGGHPIVKNTGGGLAQ